MVFNRPFFFDAVRADPAHGHLTGAQVSGFSNLLDAWERRRADRDERWLAYALATAWHETAFTMAPIDERGSSTRFERLYGPAGVNPVRARAMGNTDPGDGARYHGRGFVQLTFRRNYAAASDALSEAFGRQIDLVEAPELACRVDYAAEILFQGLESGLFTGRGLALYFSVDGDGQPVRDDWTGARATVNGRDKAATIAGYGRAFYRALAHTVTRTNTARSVFCI